MTFPSDVTDIQLCASGTWLYTGSRVMTHAQIAYLYMRVPFSPIAADIKRRKVNESAGYLLLNLLNMLDILVDHYFQTQRREESLKVLCIVHYLRCIDSG